MKRHQLDWRKFGRDLKRGRLRYSLREMGELTGVNYTTLGRAERGRALDAPDFIRLCRFLRLDPFDYMMNGRK